MLNSELKQASEAAAVARGVVIAAEGRVVEGALARLGTAASLPVAGKSILAHVLDWAEAAGAPCAYTATPLGDPARGDLNARPRDCAMTVHIAASLEQARRAAPPDACVLRGDVAPTEATDHAWAIHPPPPLTAAVYHAANMAALRSDARLTPPPGWRAAADVWLEWAPGVAPRSICGPVHVGRGAEVAGSARLDAAVIGAFAVIGRGARITRSVVAPYTLIPAGARVDNAIIGPGVLIPLDAAIAAPAPSWPTFAATPLDPHDGAARRRAS